MATFNYTNARLIATRLIEKFGDSSQFVVEGNEGGYDDDGNALPAQPDVNITGTVTPLLQYKSMEIDGSLVQSGDSYVFFDSNTDVPIGAVININSDKLRAVNSIELKSVGGTKVYQRIQLRR